MYINKSTNLEVKVVSHYGTIRLINSNSNDYTIKYDHYLDKLTEQEINNILTSYTEDSFSKGNNYLHLSLFWSDAITSENWNKMLEAIKQIKSKSDEIEKKLDELIDKKSIPEDLINRFNTGKIEDIDKLSIKSVVNDVPELEFEKYVINGSTYYVNDSRRIVYTEYLNVCEFMNYGDCINSVKQGKYENFGTVLHKYNVDSVLNNLDNKLNSASKYYLANHAYSVINESKLKEVEACDEGIEEYCDKLHIYIDRAYYLIELVGLADKYDDDGYTLNKVIEWLQAVVD